MNEEPLWKSLGAERLSLLAILSMCSTACYGAVCVRHSRLTNGLVHITYKYIGCAFLQPAGTTSISRAGVQPEIG